MKKYLAPLAIALVAATPSPKPSAHAMMNGHNSMMSHAPMKASPKPSPMHSGAMMSHGSMMKASPKPSSPPRP